MRPLYSTPLTSPTLGPMASSPWRVYFTVGDYGHFVALQVQQRLTRIVPDASGRQALWLPVLPLDAVSESLSLLDPIFAHYAAQWPKMMKGFEENEFRCGFYLDGEDLPEQIADPSRGDELDVIAWRNIPPETRREWERGGGDEGLRHALTVDLRLIEWDIYMSGCVVAAEVGIEPYPGG
jgi:hypothetical protein